MIFAALVGGAASVTYADIYKCVDGSGHVTYSNVQDKGCKRLLMDPVTTVPSPPARAKAAPAASPSDFPRVDPGTQRNRDDGRRRILESELESEQRLLAEAKKALAEQEAQRLGGEQNYQRVIDRVQPFKDKVALHERNIESLNKELANLK